VHPQIIKLSKIGPFYYNTCLSTSKMGFKSLICPTTDNWCR